MTSPFILAIDKNLSLDELNTLVNCGCDINMKDAKGRTALMIACYRQNLEFVQFLINNGADINCTDNQSNTCLMYLYDCPGQFNLKYQISEFLISKGANLQVCNQKGNTIFMKACSGRCDLDHLKWLISKGSNPRCLNNEGTSAIEICMLRNMKDAYEYLSYIDYQLKIYPLLI